MVVPVVHGQVARFPRGLARVAALAAAAALALPALAACSGGAPRTGPSSGVAGTVTVFAAASLTDAFGKIGDAFEAANPGTSVEFNFAASSALATQINEGAPADVFAAANTTTMTTVTDAANTDGDPVVFVRNQLVIAVAKGNPKGIEGLVDLTGPGVTVALCAEQVPCGAASRAAIDSAGLTVTPVSFEENVRAALTKVSLGEVDAALVYRTDAAVDESVDAVEFPESTSAINDYPIVVLKQAPNRVGGEAFVAYVRSAEGAATLAEYGFQQP